MKLWHGLVLLITLLGFNPAYAFTLSLDEEQWHLVSKPGDSNETVAQVFAGELNAADYGEQWIVFYYDTDERSYEKASIDDVIEPGVAFWFQHFSGNTVELEIDVFAPTVSLTNQSPCPSPFGCFEFALPAGNGVNWSLIGAPFPEGVEVRDLILVTSAGACQDGCTLEQALSAGLVGDRIFRFDSGAASYSQLAPEDYLMSPDGHWLTTSIPAEAGPARLLIPTYCTPFT